MKLVFIVGPTGTGKSNLAINVANKINGEIISCDSMQIYKNMDIGTAKVSKREQELAKHHLIDVADPADTFDVSTYQKYAENIIQNLFLENKTPIFAGGTGLYVNSIIYPMSFSKNEKNEELRNELKEYCEKYGVTALHKKLEELDVESANKLHENDVKRVIRAIEIAVSGEKKSSLDEMKKPKYEYIMVGLNTDRALLYERINRRVDLMFENGLENEVKNLLSKGVGFDKQSMQAIGYKEFKGYFEGEISIDDVKELIKKNSRNYAKRQITWFKKYENIKWFDVSEIDEALNYIINNLD
ncbi:MAG: tRNA (adenosine(37)-N6)-dimethylallyltransferase MiaA [Clostridia bacterium]|nr:tRNA (adenosine(37)-N6)-dimethylallyltransferase MiaA [Clostridia bacterium]MDY5263431.1 tRNA (adenosine(37)-N6)-dimethylallyltransferase MiaA [Eubacteriales bacterium]